MGIIIEYPSLVIAAKETDSHVSAIAQCCKGKRDKHNNITWKYKQNNA